MKFPIEFDLTLSAKKSAMLTLENAAEKLRRGLKRHKVADLSENKQTFEFRGGMFRMTTNGNLFYAVSTAKITLFETNDELMIRANLYYTGASLTHMIFLRGIIFVNINILKQNGLREWPLNLCIIGIGILIPLLNISISRGRIKEFLQEILT